MITMGGSSLQGSESVGSNCSSDWLCDLGKAAYFLRKTA